MRAGTLRPWLLVGAAALAAVFCLTPWSRPLDYAAYDTFFALRGAQPLPDDILFVAIDETSFAEIKLQWPWPRKLHAEVLENLFAGGAKTVAIDILFTEPSTPADDAALATVLNRYGPVILANDVSRADDNRFAVETLLEPLPVFRTPLSRTGHIRTPSDSDGFVRRAELELRNLKALGYMAALAFSDGHCCTNLPANNLPLINFSGDMETIRTVSYYQALQPEKYLPADTFRDKLVILGVNTTSSAMPEERHPDHFPTPFTRWGGGYMPGSLVHANVAANLLAGQFISTPGMPLVAATGLLLAISFGFVTLRLSFYQSTAIAVLLAALLLVISYTLFSDRLLYVSPVGLLLPLVAAYLFSPYYRYLEEARQRAFIRKAFSSYVNPSIVSQLEKNPDAAKLGGKQVDGTALFLDIAGFTALSERHSPETVVAFINDFMSALIDIAMEHGGTVERFLGDAIMVIWGAPVEQTDHAQRACRAALAMANEIARVASLESERLGTPVHARIGINSGSMTAGNIGANRRFNYTVLGDCVNLAARLEGLNKIYGTTVIVGEATATQLGDEFVLRCLDSVTVKGRRQPERIYELVGSRDTVPAENSAAGTAYAQGLEQYRQRNWEAAIQYFQAVLAANYDDKAAQLLLQRCRQFQQNPPPADWRGVTDIAEK